MKSAAHRLPPSCAVYRGWGGKRQLDSAPSSSPLPLRERVPEGRVKGFFLFFWQKDNAEPLTELFC